MLSYTKYGRLAELECSLLAPATSRTTEQSQYRESADNRGCPCLPDRHGSVQCYVGCLSWRRTWNRKVLVGAAPRGLGTLSLSLDCSAYKVINLPGAIACPMQTDEKTCTVHSWSLFRNHPRSIRPPSQRCCLRAQSRRPGARIPRFYVDPGIKSRGRGGIL